MLLRFRFQRQQTKNKFNLDVLRFYFVLKGISVPTGKRNKHCEWYEYLKYMNFSLLISGPIWEVT